MDPIIHTLAFFSSLLLSDAEYDGLVRWYSAFVEDGAAPLPSGERRALVLVGHVATGVSTPAPVGFGYSPDHALAYAWDAVASCAVDGYCDGY